MADIGDGKGSVRDAAAVVRLRVLVLARDPGDESKEEEEEEAKEEGFKAGAVTAVVGVYDANFIGDKHKRPSM